MFRVMGTILSNRLHNPKNGRTCRLGLFLEGYYNSGLGLDWTGKTLFSFGSIQDIYSLSYLLAFEANLVPVLGGLVLVSLPSRQEKRRHVFAALCNPRAIKSLLALALA